MSEEAKKLEVVGEIDSYEDAILCSVGVSGEEGIICLSHDKTLKVWIKRSTGQYWPSISYTLPTLGYCMAYGEESLSLHIGLESGVVMEFQIADDYNKLTHIKNYTGHSVRVTGVVVQVGGGKLITSSSDRSVMCHSMEDGIVLSAYQHNIPLTCVECDKDSSSIYAGDNKGNILVLSQKQTSLCKEQTLKKHQGRIECMLLSEMDGKKVLFTAGMDACVCVFDVLECVFLCRLVAHRSPIHSLHHHPTNHHLFSSSYDGELIKWDMQRKRSLPTEWHENDACELCQTPFYWNFSKMWQNKTLGVRQHHCRLCGRALCMKCTDRGHSIPSMGFEKLVRLCVSCYDDLKVQNQISLCTRFQLPSPTTHLHHETTKNIIIASTKDRSIQIFKGDI